MCRKGFQMQYLPSRLNILSEIELLIIIHLISISYSLVRSSKQKWYAYC